MNDLTLSEKLTLQLDVYLLAQKWRGLLKKARMKQLQPDEYSSGTEYVVLCIGTWFFMETTLT